MSDIKEIEVDGNIYDIKDATARQAITTLQGVTDSTFKAALKTYFLNTFYPVGSYYETSNASFNPNTAWGGTWSKETEGYVHVSAGSTYVVGTNYGSNTHTHTTSGHTLTISEIPAHTHGSKSLTGWIQFRRMGPTVNTGNPITGYSGIVESATEPTGQPTSQNFAGVSGINSTKHLRLGINATHTHNSVGGSGSHTHGATGSSTRNSWQPSKPVYRWYRTA